MQAVTAYPDSPTERTRWIEAMRRFAPEKNALDPGTPYAYLDECELSAEGYEIPTATVFLTNRECPYRCLMCDLWQNTLDVRVPSGAIAAQVRYALDRLPMFTGADSTLLARSQIKLYNAGSFFDPAAIPPEDYKEIASAVSGFGRVVVECHPALIGKRTLEFRQWVAGDLEVAMGLETAHPDVLDRLNKRFTLDDFRASAAFLRDNGIALRVFLLLNPPFLDETEGLAWAKRSLEFAFDAGASTCCIIPTRGGNGAMEHLASEGRFVPPRLNVLEEATEYGLGMGRGRVFADLWDAERFTACTCSADRVHRLEIMNRTQSIPPPVTCEKCAL